MFASSFIHLVLSPLAPLDSTLPSATRSTNDPFHIRLTLSARTILSRLGVMGANLRNLVSEMQQAGFDFSDFNYKGVPALDGFGITDEPTLRKPIKALVYRNNLGCGTFCLHC